MPERQLRPFQSPAVGRVTSDHDPALWRIAAIRYHEFMSRGYGPGDFHVGIPPHPDSPEASLWSWCSKSEIAVLPPFTFRIRMLEENDIDTVVISDEIVTEQLRCWTTHSDKRVYWAQPPNDSRDEWNTLNWPQAATALLVPARMLHGWDPQWDDATPTTIAGRPGTRVPLALTIPWSDPRSYGDSDLPYWFDVSAETAEVVIDDARGVIVEWNGLVDGKVFERNAFTTIDFNAPLTDHDFDPSPSASRNAEVDPTSANRCRTLRRA